MGNGVRVGVGVAVGVAVAVGEGVCVAVSVCVGVGEFVGVGVAVGECVAVCVGEGGLVDDGDAVGVDVASQVMACCDTKSPATQSAITAITSSAISQPLPKALGAASDLPGAIDGADGRVLA